MKVTPKSEEVRVHPETHTLIRDEARSEINPPDMNALEAALTLRERHGGRIRLLAMGPPLFDEYLRVALAMGADEAYLLSDRAFAGADTLATSHALAAGVRKLGGADLILCGEESADGATAQVPPGLAEWLDVAQITGAVEARLVNGCLRAKRALHGGHEVVEARLPAVVSVTGGANEPRFLDMSRWAWAHQTPITVWTAEDLGVDLGSVGAAGSPTEVSGTSEAPRRERRRERVTGSPADQARLLLAHLEPHLDIGLQNHPH